VHQLEDRVLHVHTSPLHSHYDYMFLTPWHSLPSGHTMQAEKETTQVYIPIQTEMSQRQAVGQREDSEYLWKSLRQPRTSQANSPKMDSEYLWKVKDNVEHPKNNSGYPSQPTTGWSSKKREMRHQKGIKKLVQLLKW
jgi:hypothetical protein